MPCRCWAAPSCSPPWRRSRCGGEVSVLAIIGLPVAGLLVVLPLDRVLRLLGLRLPVLRLWREGLLVLRLHRVLLAVLRLRPIRLLVLRLGPIVLIARLRAVARVILLQLQGLARGIACRSGLARDHRRRLAAWPGLWVSPSLPP